MSSWPPEAVWDSHLCVYIPRPKWNAYNFFLYANKQVPDTKSTPKGTPKGTPKPPISAKEIRNKYRDLSEEEKQKYQESAEEDKKRKQQADDEYEEKGYFTLQDGTLSKDLPEPTDVKKATPKSQLRRTAGKSSVAKQRMSQRSTQPIKLHYFNLMGRAETTRMILAYYDTPYDDCRIEMEEWEEYKSNLQPDFGQLPCLEVDGLRLVQSVAINQYLCRRFGAEPRTQDDHYRVDSLVQFKEDLQTTLFELAWNKQTDKMDQWYRETAPGLLQMLEFRLCGNLDGDFFFVNRRESLADFTWFELAYDWFVRPAYVKYEPILAQNAPKFRALVGRMMEKNEGLKSYLEGREELWF